MRTERGRAALITRFITALRRGKLGPSFTYFYPSNYGGKTPYFMFFLFIFLTLIFHHFYLIQGGFT